MPFISKERLDERLSSRYKDGVSTGKDTAKLRIEELEKQNKKLKKENERLDELHKDYAEKTNTEIDRLNIKIEVYEEERDEVRDQVKLQIENDDKLALLEAKADSLDEREARLKDREKAAQDLETIKETKGYSNGLADGLRKIAEITQGDRDNAMKIAMVSAASHTPVENMKEVNSALQITDGSNNR